MISRTKFPVTARSEGEVHEVDLQVRQGDVQCITSAFIWLAQAVLDAIWLDLGALNQGYKREEIKLPD